MSRKRVYSQESLDIQRRFFVALDKLLDENCVDSITMFCQMYNIDVRNFCKQRSDYSRGYFQPGWLYPLVCYYHISARWLITGNGSMTTAHY